MQMYRLRVKTKQDLITISKFSIAWWYCEGKGSLQDTMENPEIPGEQGEAEAHPLGVDIPKPEWSP